MNLPANTTSGQCAHHQLVEMLDHEVRSPLTLVYGWAEMLLESAEDGHPADVALLVHLNDAVSGVTQLVVRILEESTRRLADGEQLNVTALLRIVQELRAQRARP